MRESSEVLDGIVRKDKNFRIDTLSNPVTNKNRLQHAAVVMAQYDNDIVEHIR